MDKQKVNGKKVKELEEVIDPKKLRKLERDLARASLQLHHTSDTMSYVKAIHRYNVLNSQYAHLTGRPYNPENTRYPVDVRD